MTAALSPFRVWADMVKLSHSIFALPFALMAAFLAGRNIDGRGWPYWGQLGLIVVCMVAGRSVAMTFNRIVDAEIDARNPRTAQRPLPAGKLTRAAAWMMLAISAITFVLGCLGFHLFFDNTWPILLSGPVLLYLCGYSYMKWFTRWSHYYLGSAIALSPVAAWLAIHPDSLALSAWLLMGTVTCWIGGFDIIYSCQDIEVDRRDGLHSLPADLGPGKALWVARASHLLVVLFLVLLGVAAKLGTVYGCGVALVAGLLVVENALVRPGDYGKVNLAFFTINGIVSVALALATILDCGLNTVQTSAGMPIDNPVSLMQSPLGRGFHPPLGRDSYLAPSSPDSCPVKLAGKDSRRRACEKGFSHEQSIENPQPAFRDPGSDV